MLRILLAEDNPADVLLVRQALKEQRVEHELHLVRDGEEALAYLAQMRSPPDLVLLDINLPKVDGPEVLREFRKRPECKKTPVVVVTSSDALRDRKQMADLGSTRYFKKPSDWESFLRLGEIVREVMGAH